MYIICVICDIVAQVSLHVCSFKVMILYSLFNISLLEDA